MSDHARSSQRHHVVAFVLDGKVFALPLPMVIKVTETSAILPLPDFSGYVVGRIHGQQIAIPAVPLREQLGLPAAPLKPHTPVLLAEVQEQLLGLIVDEVMGMVEIETGLDVSVAGEWEEISFPSPRGVGLLINPSRLFTAEQMLTFRHIVSLLPDAGAPAPAPLGA